LFTSLNGCIAGALSRFDDDIEGLSDEDATTLIEKTEELLRLSRERMRILARGRQRRSRRQYFDDERGPDESRYVIEPVRTKTGRFWRYAATDDGRLIDEAADEAKALEHVANNPPDRE
jgi:hypothetical protein